MILKEFPASPATRHLVRGYRVVHFTLGATRARAVKVYTPTAEQCLQLFGREQESVEYPDGRRLQWASVITGAHDITVRRIVPADFLMVQVVFQPSGLHRLAGLPGGELHNQYVDAEAVFGADVKQATAAIQDARTYGDMIRIADRSAFGVTPEMLQSPPQGVADMLRAFRPVLQREVILLGGSRGAIPRWPLSDFFDGLETATLQ
jgi:hypothetical protein